MIKDQTTHPSAENHRLPVSPLEQTAWLFMRLSGLLLLVMAVGHLMYMTFIIPGGVGAITYQVILDRWTDPVWGFAARLFDLLLLLLGLAHGGNGLRKILADTVHGQTLRRLLVILLGGCLLALAATGARIIFWLPT